MATRARLDARAAPHLHLRVEEALAGTSRRCTPRCDAFNRWLLEEWGFAGPTVAAPMIAMSDVAGPSSSSRWALVGGRRHRSHDPGPVRRGRARAALTGPPAFDPFWQTIVAAGVAVAYHAADSGYFRYFRDYDDPPVINPFSPAMRLGSLFAVDRPMQDMVAMLVMQQLLRPLPHA